MTNPQNRLYRSQKNKVIAGVCGGLGEYLNVDATIIRIIWIILTLFGGSGIIVYILAYFIVPLRPLGSGDTAQYTKPDLTASKIFGITFVIIGTVVLLDNLDILSFHHWWNMSWDYVLPSVLILIGIFFLMKRSAAQTQDASLKESQSENGYQGSFVNPEPNTDNTAKYKVLRRSITDRKFLGICGGLGEYLDIDPTIIRIGYVIFTVLSGGIGVVCYFLMLLVIPEGQLQSSK